MIKEGDLVECQYIDITYHQDESEKNAADKGCAVCRVFGRLGEDLIQDKSKVIMIISEDTMNDAMGEDTNYSMYLIPEGCIISLKKLVVKK